ncbi:hypothetical protein [Kribbella deserti]|uniref:Uncharacterized protein n=1 Tax=Kribbella deserti TaxID=1926257 RepID=A0ABV6QFM4_9ACTN
MTHTIHLTTWLAALSTSDPQTLVYTAVTAFAGGSFLAGAVAAYSAKKKAPAERDSIIVTGAQTAVVALEAVLEAETARANRAEADLERERERRLALEIKLDVIQAALDEARNELHDYITERPVTA